MGTVALGAVAVSSTAVFYIAACNTSMHHCTCNFFMLFTDNSYTFC